MSDLFSLQGHHALITGGTRGIGFAIAKIFLEHGSKVTICSRKQENVDSALEQLESNSSVLQGFATNVGDSAAVDTLLLEAKKSFGTIDILVNNAGTNPYYGPLVNSSEEAFQKTLDTNLIGPYQLARSVAKQLIADERPGSIINVASILGVQADSNQAFYSVSKAALIMLTQCMAREWGEHKIRANSILPGIVETKLSEALWKDNEKVANVIKQQTALHRFAQPNELTGIALYLASAAGSFTTGSQFKVDGGFIT